MKENSIAGTDEAIMDKIFLLRGKKVMLDRDLAKLYGVETRRLKEQVKRNLSRFPEDFMFELTSDELEEWRNIFGNTNREIKGLRILPFAFTERVVALYKSLFI